MKLCEAGYKAVKTAVQEQATPGSPSTGGCGLVVACGLFRTLSGRLAATHRPNPATACFLTRTSPSSTGLVTSRRRDNLKHWQPDDAEDMMPLMRGSERSRCFSASTVEERRAGKLSS